MLGTEDWPLVLAVLPRETGYYTKEFSQEKFSKGWRSSFFH